MRLIPDAPDIRATLLTGYPACEQYGDDDYFDYPEEEDNDNGETERW